MKDYVKCINSIFVYACFPLSWRLYIRAKNGIVVVVLHPARYNETIMLLLPSIITDLAVAPDDALLLLLSFPLYIFIVKKPYRAVHITQDPSKRQGSLEASQHCCCCLLVVVVA